MLDAVDENVIWTGAGAVSADCRMLAQAIRVAILMRTIVKSVYDFAGTVRRFKNVG
jgi:hypothetical protein